MVVVSDNSYNLLNCRLYLLGSTRQTAELQNVSFEWEQLLNCSRFWGSNKKLLKEWQQTWDRFLACQEAAELQP
jgi:hypothetical protein